MTNLLINRIEQEMYEKKKQPTYGGRGDEERDVKEAGAGAAWLMSTMKCNPCWDGLKDRRGRLFSINCLIAPLWMHLSGITRGPGLPFTLQIILTSSGLGRAPRTTNKFTLLWKLLCCLQVDQEIPGNK